MFGFIMLNVGLCITILFETELGLKITVGDFLSITLQAQRDCWLLVGLIVLKGFKFTLFFIPDLVPYAPIRVAGFEILWSFDINFALL